jgi:hypothetical protein
MTTILRTGESISLTTGQVTRTTDTRTDLMISHNRDFRERIMSDSRKRVQRNDMNALAYVIRHS